MFGKGLIFALKVWDCSKKQEQASAREGNRTQHYYLTGEHPNHYTKATLIEKCQKLTKYTFKLF